MKRYSKKTDLTADRCLQKEGNTPRNPQRRAGKHTSPHRAIPAIVENVENLEFIRKSRWKNIETRGFQLLKTVNRQALDQAINHVHSFQHASEQAFFRSLWHHQNAFHRNAQLTWCFSNPAAKSSHQLKKPSKLVGRTRNFNNVENLCTSVFHTYSSFHSSFQQSLNRKWKTKETMSSSL